MILCLGIGFGGERHYKPPTKEEIARREQEELECKKRHEEKVRELPNDLALTVPGQIALAKKRGKSELLITTLEKNCSLKEQLRVAEHVGAWAKKQRLYFWTTFDADKGVLSLHVGWTRESADRRPLTRKQIGRLRAAATIARRKKTAEKEARHREASHARELQEANQRAWEAENRRRKEFCDTHGYQNLGMHPLNCNCKYCDPYG